MKKLLLAVLCIAGAQLGMAQNTVPSPPPEKTSQDWNSRLLQGAQMQAVQGDRTQESYRIGPEDLVEITVFEVPELSRTVRVSTSGDISIPLIGTLKAAGLSPIELEKKLTDSLRKSYVKDPQVSVFLKEYRSAPVSVMGAVKAPGLYQIQTKRTLIEVLAMAQGFSESQKMLPGRTIVITHQPRWEPSSSPSEAEPAEPWQAIEEVPIKQLLESGESKWNVAVYPGDIIKVVPAGTFYVAGDVNTPGGFPLTDFDNVSAMQAVAMAGGTTKTAKLKDALIIRTDPSGKRLEEKVDLKLVLQGKATDVKLGANDILFVPGSMGKEAGLRGIEAAIQIATGVLIWGL